MSVGNVGLVVVSAIVGGLLLLVILRAGLFFRRLLAPLAEARQQRAFASISDSEDTSQFTGILERKALEKLFQAKPEGIAELTQVLRLKDLEPSTLHHLRRLILERDSRDPLFLDALRLLCRIYNANRPTTGAAT